MATGANLTDKPRSNSGIADANFDLFNQNIRQFATGHFFDDRRIAEIAIPATAHQDVDSCPFGKSDQSFRVSPNLIQRDIADRLAASTEEFLHFVSDQIFVIDHIFVVRIMPHRIEDEMFVSLGDSHLVGPHGAEHGNDFTRIQVG